MALEEKRGKDTERTFPQRKKTQYIGLPEVSIFSSASLYLLHHHHHWLHNSRKLLLQQSLQEAVYLCQPCASQLLTTKQNGVTSTHGSSSRWQTCLNIRSMTELDDWSGGLWSLSLMVSKIDRLPVEQKQARKLSSASTFFTKLPAGDTEMWQEERVTIKWCDSFSSNLPHRWALKSISEGIRGLLSEVLIRI